MGLASWAAIASGLLTPERERFVSGTKMGAFAGLWICSGGFSPTCRIVSGRFDILMRLHVTTACKLRFARLLYRFARLFVGDEERVIERGGIRYRVDLAEGIDLSIFLFGTFQSAVIKNKLFHLPPDAVALDVGANIGHMSLKLGKELPQGRVISFEPTHFAFRKFMSNLELNPELKGRITPVNSFLSSSRAASITEPVYASWRVDGVQTGKAHSVHQGIPMGVGDVPTTCIDDYFLANPVHRLDYMKIDTDGYELSILQGSVETIGRFRPTIVFEVGAYILKEKGIAFRQYLELFKPLGYIVKTLDGAPVTEANWESFIPAESTVDYVALPLGRN